MRRFPRLYVVAWAALAVAVACTAANAQPPRGPRGPGGPPGFGGPGGFGGGGLVGLLMIEEVRKELGVTSDQEAKLREYGEKRREEARKRFEGMQDLSREERQRRFEQMREEFAKEAEKNAKEAEKTVQGILKPDQFKRLKQIELQQQARREGPEILLRPDIAQALAFTDDQKGSLEKIVGDFRKKRDAMREDTMKLFQGFREMSEEERGKAREKMTASREKGQQLQNEAQKTAMAVLTDEQKGKLKQVMGEAFQMPERQGFGRGGPGGGEGDRGGRRGGGRDRGERGGGPPRA